MIIIIVKNQKKIFGYCCFYILWIEYYLYIKNIVVTSGGGISSSSSSYFLFSRTRKKKKSEWIVVIFINLEWIRNYYYCPMLKWTSNTQRDDENDSFQNSSFTWDIRGRKLWLQKFNVQQQLWRSRNQSIRPRTIRFPERGRPVRRTRIEEWESSYYFFPIITSGNSRINLK